MKKGFEIETGSVKVDEEIYLGEELSKEDWEK